MPASPAVATRTPAPLQARLALLLFGEFAVWGSWFVSLGSWLGTTLHFSGPQIGMLYGTFAVAGLVTPMLAGVIADRLAHTERMLAVLHGIGGLLLLVIASQRTFTALYVAILLYALCYLPTISLATSLSMRHLVAPAAEYPRLRTLGTIGWITAGIIVGLFALELSPVPMQLAGVTSLVLAAYCLTLPATPPLSADAPRSVGTLLGLDALALMRDPLFALFVIATIVLSVPNQFYNAFAALYLTELRVPHPAMLLTLGQVTEVGVLLLLPRVYRGIGARRVLLIGGAAWAARCLLFSLGGDGSVVPIYGGILLHGVVYGCIYVAGQLMVHERAPENMRAAAQGFMGLATMGVGNLGGAWIAGRSVARYTGAANQHDWTAIWLVAAAVSAAATLGILLSARADDTSRARRA
ncbi:MAG TPA: MFS transporter [Gemmatimonadaceae bacterium]|nr:MFS transporter [Gemmatimonadaceae bacterium]